MPNTHGRSELFTLSLDKITTMRGTSGELERTYRRRLPRRTEPLRLGGDRGLVGGSLRVVGRHLGLGELDVAGAGADAGELSACRSGDPLGDWYAMVGGCQFGDGRGGGVDLHG